MTTEVVVGCSFLKKLYIDLGTEPSITPIGWFLSRIYLDYQTHLCSLFLYLKLVIAFCRFRLDHRMVMISAINNSFLASILCISAKLQENNNNVRRGFVRDGMSVNYVSIYLNSYKQPYWPAILAPSAFVRRNIPLYLPRKYTSWSWGQLEILARSTQSTLGSSDQPFIPPIFVLHRELSTPIRYMKYSQLHLWVITLKSRCLTPTKTFTMITMLNTTHWLCNNAHHDYPCDLTIKGYENTTPYTRKC